MLRTNSESNYNRKGDIKINCLYLFCKLLAKLLKIKIANERYNPIQNKYNHNSTKQSNADHNSFITFLTLNFNNKIDIELGAYKIVL